METREENGKSDSPKRKNERYFKPRHKSPPGGCENYFHDSFYLTPPFKGVQGGES